MQPGPRGDVLLLGQARDETWEVPLKTAEAVASAGGSAGSSGVAWRSESFEGAWLRGASAGGCRNFLASFAANPQFRIRLVRPLSEREVSEVGEVLGRRTRMRTTRTGSVRPSWPCSRRTAAGPMPIGLRIPSPSALLSTKLSVFALLGGYLSGFPLSWSETHRRAAWIVSISGLTFPSPARTASSTCERWMTQLLV